MLTGEVARDEVLLFVNVRDVCIFGTLNNDRDAVLVLASDLLGFLFALGCAGPHADKTRTYYFGVDVAFWAKKREADTRMG